MAKKKIKIKFYIDENMQFYYLNDSGKVLPVNMLEDDEKYIESVVKYGGCDDAAERGEYRVPKKFAYALSEDGKKYLVQKDRLVSVEEIRNETREREKEASEICTIATKLYAAQNRITDMFDPKVVLNGNNDEVNKVPYQVAKAILMKYRLFKHGCEFKVDRNFEKAENTESAYTEELFEELSIAIANANEKSQRERMQKCIDHATSITQQPQTMFVTKNGKQEKIIVQSSFGSSTSDKVGDGASEYVDLQRESNASEVARAEQIAYEKYALGGSAEEFTADRKKFVALIDKCLRDMRNSAVTTERKCAEVLDAEYISDATMDSIVTEKYIDEDLCRRTRSRKLQTTVEEKMKMCKCANTKMTYYNLLNKGVGYFGIRLYRYLILNKDEYSALLRLFGVEVLPEELEFVNKRRAGGVCITENLKNSKKK